MTVLSASSQTAAGPVENIADGLTFDWWIPDVFAGGPISTEEWVNAQSEVGEVHADYFAIAAHNLADVGGSVTPQYWDGTQYLDAGPTVTPATNAPFVGLFDAVRLRAIYRLLFEGYTDSFRIGVAAIGLSTPMLRGMPLDFVPPLASNQRVTTSNPVSIGGHLLGRHIIRDSMSVDLVQKNVPRAWVDSVWEPLVERARTEPFFFKWSADHPECIYGAMEDDARASYNQPEIMDVQLTIVGRAR